MKFFDREHEIAELRRIRDMAVELAAAGSVRPSLSPRRFQTGPTYTFMYRARRLLICAMISG